MLELRPAAVVVLAAGGGTRMRSTTPKVLHRMCGRTLLGHVMAAVAPLRAERTLVVVGAGRDEVEAHLTDVAPQAEPVLQAEQRGTGHAVRTALDACVRLDPDGLVLVVPGDTPLLTTGTLEALVGAHRHDGAAATLLTVRAEDPKGYGRVVRDDGGAVVAVVEERDADAATKTLTEVNTSVYAFAAGPLAAALQRLRTDNAQGEEYLTDVVALLRAEGLGVAAHTAPDPQEAAGVNDRVQLAQARRAMRDRLVRAAMLAGVTVTDPQTTWFGVGVTFEPDATLLQNTRLHGRSHVAAGAVVGPDTILTDTRVEAGATVVGGELTATTVGAGARVRFSCCEGARIGAGATVGPFTYLRPGTVLGRRSKAGAYVEVKNATVGDDSKVPHLSYVGDATIGERSNIGAATVFVNYDGVAKHHSVVGDDVRVGSDSMLVAPLHIGDGAYTAAGSVVDSDVPPGALAVGRARQRNVDGWVQRRRPGSPAAAAAARAQRTVDAPGTAGRGGVEPATPAGGDTVRGPGGAAGSQDAGQGARGDGS